VVNPYSQHAFVDSCGLDLLGPGGLGRVCSAKCHRSEQSFRGTERVALMCCMYSPSEARVASPVNEVLSRRPALQKDSPQQNVSLPTSLVCAQMKSTYHSAERAFSKVAPSDRPWVRKKPADHIPRTSTDRHTSIAGMATESLPGSGEEQWTIQ
jgi:hypothetical protein